MIFRNEAGYYVPESERLSEEEEETFENAGSACFLSGRIAALLGFNNRFAANILNQNYKYEDVLVERLNYQKDVLSCNDFSSLTEYIISYGNTDELLNENGLLRSKHGLDTDDNSWLSEKELEEKFDAFILLKMMQEKEIEVCVKSVTEWVAENEDNISQITEKDRWVWIGDDQDQVFEMFEDLINAQFDHYLERDRSKN